MSAIPEAAPVAAPPSLRGALRLRQGAFELDSGEFAWPLEGVTALFGPSGCGKSTLLRAIAGLLPAVRGHLAYGDEVWLDDAGAVPPQRRGIGFVFQNAALFPHLDVLGNLEFARRRSGASGSELEARVGQLGIGHLLGRGVGRLSGGERQRVALARALLARPRMLVLDEPLAALDWRARDALLDLIDSLAREAALPMLLVSHSPHEVERLADRVVLMESGRAAPALPLRQALLRADSPLFDQLGPVAVLEGHAEALEEGLARVDVGGRRLTIPASPRPGPARVRVYARDVALGREAPAGTSVLNHLPARVVEIAASRPGHVLARLELDDGQGLWSELTRPGAASLGLAEGQRVVALVKTASLQR